MICIRDFVHVFSERMFSFRTKVTTLGASFTFPQSCNHIHHTKRGRQHTTVDEFEQTFCPPKCRKLACDFVQTHQTKCMDCKNFCRCFNNVLWRRHASQPLQYRPVLFKYDFFVCFFRSKEKCAGFLGPIKVRPFKKHANDHCHRSVQRVKN